MRKDVPTIGSVGPHWGLGESVALCNVPFEGRKPGMGVRNHPEGSREKLHSAATPARTENGHTWSGRVDRGERDNCC